MILHLVYCLQTFCQLVYDQFGYWFCHPGITRFFFVNFFILGSSHIACCCKIRKSLSLYMNIVKQAPSEHSFYYNVVNNSLMATGFGHKTVFRLHTKTTASYCTRKCMPTFPSQSPVPVIKLNTYYGIPSIK